MFKQALKWAVATVLGLLLCGAVARQAHACSIAQDRLTGGYYIKYYQGGPTGTLTEWGDVNNSALWVNAINKSCNDLQSFGSVEGNIRWFGDIGAPNYYVGDGPDGGTYRCGWLLCHYTNFSHWINPNESAVFYWNDGTQWDRAVSCAPTSNYFVVGGVVRVQWSCTHQQSRDGGKTWGGTSYMLLNPAL